MTKQTLKEQNDDEGGASAGVIWVDHPKVKGQQLLHVKKPFGTTVPYMLDSRSAAKVLAARYGGMDVKVSDNPSRWNVHRRKPLVGVREEYGAGEDASTEAAMNYKKDTPGQDGAEMPYRKTIKTIKKFIRSKYNR